MIVQCSVSTLQQNARLRKAMRLLRLPTVSIVLDLRIISHSRCVRCLTAGNPKRVLHSATYCFLLQFKVSSRLLKVIH